MGKEKRESREDIDDVGMGEQSNVGPTLLGFYLLVVVCDFEECFWVLL